MSAAAASGGLEQLRPPATRKLPIHKLLTRCLTGFIFK